MFKKKKVTEAKLDSLEKAGYLTFRQMAKGVKKFDEAPGPVRAKPDSASDVYGIVIKKKRATPPQGHSPTKGR